VLVSGESVCCVDVDGNGDGARAAAVGAGARVGAGFAVVGVAACFVTHEYVGAVMIFLNVNQIRFLLWVQFESSQTSGLLVS